MSGFDRDAGPRVAVRSRRFGERATVSWTVWVQAGQQRMRCHTVDVSSRGAKLRPRGLFPVGTPLQMEFIKPDGRRLRVSGVAWRAEADAMAVMFLGTIRTRWLTYSGVPTTIISPRRFQNDTRTLYPGPRVIQLLATTHFFGSRNGCVTRICDTEAPTAAQDGRG